MYIRVYQLPTHDIPKCRGQMKNLEVHFRRTPSHLHKFSPTVVNANRFPATRQITAALNESKSHPVDLPSASARSLEYGRNVKRGGMLCVRGHHNSFRTWPTAICVGAIFLGVGRPKRSHSDWQSGRGNRSHKRYYRFSHHPRRGAAHAVMRNRKLDGQSCPRRVRSGSPNSTMPNGAGCAVIKLDGGRIMRE
jgi:hypothetical protein